MMSLRSHLARDAPAWRLGGMGVKIYLCIIDKKDDFQLIECVCRAPSIGVVPSF